MRRYNFFVLQDWLDVLDRNKKKFGCTTTAGLVRYIIQDFIKSKKLK